MKSCSIEGLVHKSTIFHMLFLITGRELLVFICLDYTLLCIAVILITLPFCKYRFLFFMTFLRSCFSKYEENMNIHWILY